MSDDLSLNSATNHTLAQTHTHTLTQQLVNSFSLINVSYNLYNTCTSVIEIVQWGCRDGRCAKTSSERGREGERERGGGREGGGKRDQCMYTAHIISFSSHVHMVDMYGRLYLCQPPEGYHSSCKESQNEYEITLLYMKLLPCPQSLVPQYRSPISRVFPSPQYPMFPQWNPSIRTPLN